MKVAEMETDGANEAHVNANRRHLTELADRGTLRRSADPEDDCVSGGRRREEVDKALVMVTQAIEGVVAVPLPDNAG
jgi:hypothetical protein